MGMAVVGGMNQGRIAIEGVIKKCVVWQKFSHAR